MAEMTGWQQGAEQGELGQLFWLASELDPSAEGRRRRQREKEQLLASAGVVLPGESGRWQEGKRMEILLSATCPNPPYPTGTSPRGGTNGGTGRRRW